MTATHAPFDDVPDLTAREVAQALGLSYHAVLRAAKREEMTGYKICGRWRFYRDDVLRWIDACRVVKPAQERPSAQLPLAPPPARGSRAALRALEQRPEPERG